MRARWAAVVLVVALSGCGEDSTSAPAGATGERPATSGVAEPPPTSAAPTTVGIDPLDGASTDPVIVTEQPAETALLERVALARHEGYDRVVFEFRNVRPAYRVEYVEPPLKQDGSGNVIEVDGRAFVQVRFEPASGYDLEADEMAYTGPPRLKGADHGTAIVREVARVSDFEAALIWAVGVDDRVEFRAHVLDDPPRLVVDLRNH